MLNEMYVNPILHEILNQSILHGSGGMFCPPPI